MSSENPQRAMLAGLAELSKGLAHPHRLEILAQLARGERSVAARHSAQVREVTGGYFHIRDALAPVSRAELVRRLKEDVVTVLDVRPVDEYAAGHLPHVVNIPLRELSRRLREIPRDREIVAYCQRRGPCRVLAFEAVALLRGRGFKGGRLDDGFHEWRAAGLPVRLASAPASRRLGGCQNAMNNTRSDWIL